MTKPFNPVDLAPLVRAVVERARDDTLDLRRSRLALLLTRLGRGLTR